MFVDFEVGFEDGVGEIGVVEGMGGGRGGVGIIVGGVGGERVWWVYS